MLVLAEAVPGAVGTSNGVVALSCRLRNTKRHGCLLDCQPMVDPVHAVKQRPDLRFTCYHRNPPYCCRLLGPQWRLDLDRLGPTLAAGHAFIPGPEVRVITTPDLPQTFITACVDQILRKSYFCRGGSLMLPRCTWSDFSPQLHASATGDLG
eukprot:GHUV01054534.1.p1 GENE.GHUV01054534.1~~GHUV01054534.1.p1  ORF type:complete len:152 (+),score=6.73 GHUV01054534.1:347-802(+)